MGGPRAARLQVGSAPWITQERASAMQIEQSEVEEFTFSARNDFDWLNEHMAEIFSENQINVADIFKTPGKLRGKTPRTARKMNHGENRVPLSDIFSATPKGAPNPFAMSNAARSNTPRVQIAADPQTSPPKPTNLASPSKYLASPNKTIERQPNSVVDSGYHGSQSQEAMDLDDPAISAGEAAPPFSPQGATRGDDSVIHLSPSYREELSPTVHHSPEPTIESVVDDPSTQYFTAHIGEANSPVKKHTHHESTTPAGSPARPSMFSSPSKVSPTKSASSRHTPVAGEPAADHEAMETVLEEPSRSPSDGSSPIRPIVRKSSLNFASLPAREPITHKSIGNRISRTSHLDQNRTSYYNRQTGGKSLGHARQELSGDEEHDEMDIDDHAPEKQATIDAENAVTHNKTYTQRLQDQINKLGQFQANTSRPSKSVPDSTSIALPTPAIPSAQQQSTQKRPLPSPKKPTTPGAFPEDDDEDDWIQPLGPPDNASNLFSPRPVLPKSHTADVMEGVSGKETVSGGDFALPKTRKRTSRSKSPQRPMIPERTTSTLGHHKSVSVPALPLLEQSVEEEIVSKKTISVSNPALATVSETDRPTTPSKSPSRGFRDSPLKQVKNKLSSILKSSKGLLASSAAISAEGKSSLISPSTTKLGLQIAPSTESLASPLGKNAQALYPDLSRHATDDQATAIPTSPTRTEGRRTRASIEKEKAEEKRKEKEAKEARRMAEQNEKLEKAREKEREKARVFSKEQERIATMEKQLAAQQELEKKAVAHTPSNASKATRTSPRRAKPQTAEQGGGGGGAKASDEKTVDDVDMIDAPVLMPPPSAPRSAAPPSATKGREIKRPVRPAKEPIGKTKQAPTVIRVNMGSQHSQYHPSNSALASGLHDTLSQPQLKGKASQASLHAKPSLQSLKSSTSSVGRPKALEAAARRKEQEEREAQRKRDAKAEIERKRAAMQEEEKRQEQQRRAEEQRRKEEERKQANMQAEAKKNAQRQAMLEKAKQTRAPPPPLRSQPNGPPEYSRDEAAPSRPPSRMNSAVNTMLSASTKTSGKRPLQQDASEESAPRQGQARAAMALQPKESKRMRMTDELDNDVETEKQSSLKGAPVRPSGGYKKEMPTKSMFPVGYANASQHGARDLFKTTLTSQHATQVKTAHPLDMAQVSKAAIPFAPNPNPAGPSHKTPARPQGVMAAKSAAKSATRSSPRFQNGESIELPEINTDDEDDDEYDDGGKDMVAAWADSPNLRRALVEQETQDPFQVFGAPGPLNLEEVFSKNKEKFTKFRARTSSANWSGADRLTEEDIRKDLAARDRMRREGGWSYEMSRDMV
ncbi:hypothetical protein F4778DRAFT_757336 [Xylariomycetidae sp. FL2044]|nr:hypothetical protein F4778DRAFT_757336 [Xylariomycetidae sp. FL2044]